MGMEALAFCSLIVVILIVGGVVSLYEALTWAPVQVPSSAAHHTTQEQVPFYQNNKNQKYETNSTIERNVRAATPRATLFHSVIFRASAATVPHSGYATIADHNPA